MLQEEVSCDVALGKIFFIPCEIVNDLQLIKNDYKIRPYK